MKECKMLRTRSDVIACVRWLDSTGRSFRISVVPPARNTIHYSYGFLLISFPLVCSFCECHVRRDWASVVVVCVSVSFCLFRFRLSHRAEGTSTVLRLTRWRVRRRRWSQTTLILISLLKSELDTFIRCALHVRFSNEFASGLKLNGGHLDDFYVRFCFPGCLLMELNMQDMHTQRFPCK